MIVSILTGLHKTQPAGKMIHDFLPTTPVPPLHGKVILTPGADDPKGLPIVRYGRRERRVPLVIMKVDVPSKGDRLQSNLKLFREMTNISVDEVIGKFVGPVHERVMALDVPRLRIVVA
jgi:hypothetical protein